RRLRGGSHLPGLTGTSLDLGANCPPCSLDGGAPRASRLAMTVVRLSGSSSKTGRPPASLILIVALSGPPTSSIPKPSRGSAERFRGSIILTGRRSPLRDRLTTCALFSLAAIAIASVVQKCEFSRQSAAPAPTQKPIPHRPANPIKLSSCKTGHNLVGARLLLSRKELKSQSWLRYARLGIAFVGDPRPLMLPLPLRAFGNADDQP